MLEVTLLFVLSLLITLVLFEFARWLWVYCAMGSAARRGAGYAKVHGADSASPADRGKIQEVARKSFTTRVTGSIPKDLVVRTSWKPDNQPFSKVQVQAEYDFQCIAARLILSQATIPLVRTSPVMVINRTPAIPARALFTTTGRPSRVGFAHRYENSRAGQLSRIEWPRGSNPG